MTEKFSRKLWMQCLESYKDYEKLEIDVISYKNLIKCIILFLNEVIIYIYK